MLTGVHFLLTYSCTYECDHCFLYCGPRAEGVFTLEKVKTALGQMKETESVTSAYFEGGEPFLYYPLMLESLRLAKMMGFEIGIVTNAYWATSVEDARIWLQPLATIGIDDLSISDDSFHSGKGDESPARMALAAAKELGLPTGSICIEPPRVEHDGKKWHGEPVVGGDVLFKGRAADKLTNGLPRQDARIFDECPHEELKAPSRVHLDSFGFVHLCQGIVIGNIFDQSLKKIFQNFQPESHPIIGPLILGGPAELARHYGLDVSMGYVDHCHLCFEVRRRLLDNFPDHLAPKQVYGIGE